MKLQIISRLARQPSRIEQLKEVHLTTYTSTQTSHRKQPSQYCSVNEGGRASGEGVDKVNVRDFFAQFNSKCEVKYRPVDPVFREVKRKLQPVLQSLKNSQQKSSNCEVNVIPLKSEPVLYSQASLGGVNKVAQLQTDPKLGYYFQRAQQKIRKVNSLISLDNQRSTNSIESTRKPGFIRMNKSLARKDSTLQLSKEGGQQSTEESERQTKGEGKSGRSGGKMEQQINDSRERIARIRRELNEIYQMRSKPAEARLRLG